MKKAITLFAFLCAVCGPLFAGTSLLTGTLTDAQGNPLNGSLLMQLPVPAQDPATNTLISPVPVYFRVVNGAIQSGPPLFDVGTINPANLYYMAKAYDTAGNLFLYGNYVVTGTTFNLSAAIPTMITTSNVSYLNPVNVNGNNTFTGANSFTGTTTFSGTQIFQTTLTQDVSGTGCAEALNLFNTDASPTNPNKYLRVNQSTGALEFMSNGCGLIASLSDSGNFTASSGFCIGSSCITAWPGGGCTVHSVTTSYTLVATDCVVQAFAGSGSFTLVIPHSISGQNWTITRTDTSANTITVDGDSGNINNAATITLPINSTSICHADGTNSWCTPTSAAVTGSAGTMVIGSQRIEWGTSPSGISVTFPTAFSSTPVVTLTCIGCTIYGLSGTPTASGFSMSVSSEYAVEWIAIGPA
jgi:hypothetical protein